MKYTEIERKWLMSGFPDLPAQSEQMMQQAYLAFGGATVRVRRVCAEGAESYWLTIKGGGTLRRTEVELPLQPGEYEALATLALAPAAKKRLRTYALPGGLTLECNAVDEGEPTGFYYAEVEFETEEAARAFVPPAFLGREVTNEAGYTMADYCKSKAAFCAADGQNNNAD